MSLKKNLRSQRSQSVFEYILILIVLAAGIIFVFGSFKPDSMNILPTFSRTVDRAINAINTGWN